MAKETSLPASDDIQALPPLNAYVPHQWFSASTWSWLYAIKKQPPAGTWTFILEGDDVRIFES